MTVTNSPDITVLIADDHPVFRQGLRHVLESAPGFRVVAEADHGASALEAIRVVRPMVAVLDLDMPVLDGLGVARAVTAERLDAALVVLTMHKDENLFNDALDAGVLGYVLKDNAVTDITGSIRAARAGQPYISPQISSFLLTRRAGAVALVEQRPAIARLTAAERRVLRLIANGYTSRQIADTLCVSVRTVENHRANMAIKLDLRGPHAVLDFALRHRSELG